MSQADEAKVIADAFIERNLEAIALLNDSIFYFGELGMQEYRTSELMSDLLKESGFQVELGIGGFPTAFVATYGSGSPVIGIHTEYDANPDNSQVAGVLDQRCITEGAPGHCEGHNSNGAVLVASALAVKAAMEAKGLTGTVKVIGAPAEEQLLSRPYLVRDGYFDGMDVCFAPHVGSEFAAGHGIMQSALISATFSFHGESAHAGVAPWKGRDALDAVVLMDVGMAEYREHMVPGTQCQRVITNGGAQPNVIPKLASVWWYFRASSAAGAMSVFERARKVAEGAALMTDTTCEVNILSAVWPVRSNEVLSALTEREFARVGMPVWSQEEQDLALSLQRKVKVKEAGLSTTYRISRGPSQQKPSANDAGDVSWRVPMAKVYFPSNVPNISYHHWAAGVALATSIAHKGIAAGSKVVAGAILECLCSSAHVTAAKEGFVRELDGVVYQSMLPVSQKPPVELNRSTMDKFRDAMSLHYLKARPRFC